MVRFANVLVGEDARRAVRGDPVDKHAQPEREAGARILRQHRRTPPLTARRSVRELARPSVGSGDVTSVWTERVLARRVDDSPWHPECLAHPGLPLAPNWLRTDLRLGV